MIPVPSAARVWIAAGHTDMRRGMNGLSLYAKRLERGSFGWPATAGESVAITPAQLGYLLEGIDRVRRITGGRQRVRPCTGSSSSAARPIQSARMERSRTTP